MHLSYLFYPVLYDVILHAHMHIYICVCILSSVMIKIIHGITQYVESRNCYVNIYIYIAASMLTYVNWSLWDRHQCYWCYQCYNDLLITCMRKDRLKITVILLRPQCVYLLNIRIIIINLRTVIENVEPCGACRDIWENLDMQKLLCWLIVLKIHVK